MFGADRRAELLYPGAPRDSVISLTTNVSTPEAVASWTECFVSPEPRPALCEPHVIDVVLETIVRSAESLKGLPSAPPAFRLIACPLSHN